MANFFQYHALIPLNRPYILLGLLDQESAWPGLYFTAHVHTPNAKIKADRSKALPSLTPYEKTKAFETFRQEQTKHGARNNHTKKRGKRIENLAAPFLEAREGIAGLLAETLPLHKDPQRKAKD